MIKIKVTRDQLQALCAFTNPAILEAKAGIAIANKNFNDLDTLFNLMKIGEMLSKKWLFTFKSSYKIGFNHAEAASLFKQLTILLWDFDEKSFEYNVLLIVTQDLHNQLTNFQRRFYGQSNRQNLLNGGNQATGGALNNAARQLS